MIAYIKNNILFTTSPRSIKQLEETQIKTREIENEDGTVSIEEYPELVLVENPDLIDTIEIEYDDTTITDPEYRDGKIQNRQEEISDREKVERDLISREDYKKVDTKGIRDLDLQRLVLEKFFNGNQTEELELTQKLIMDPTNQEIKDFFAKKIAFSEYIRSLNS